MMGRSAAITLISILPLAAGGCVRPGLDPSLESAQLRGKLRETDAQLDAEKDRSAILAARTRELAEREQALSTQVNRLKFISEQQAAQIDTLKLAPAQRDEYKAQAKALAAQTAELNAQITALRAQVAELQHQIDLLRSSPASHPAPATLPAAP